MSLGSCTTSGGLLGDSASRDYARKLQTFNRFAEPELRQVIADLSLRPGMHVLDAGCGSGEALHWLAAGVGPQGRVFGIDLSRSHVAAARADAPAGVEVQQGDLTDLKRPLRGFDLIWCVNTVNHLREPLDGLRRLQALLAPGGRIALGQSSLLPDMFFAWDARLERLVNEAVRQYYRDRYGLDEPELTSIRAIAGLLRRLKPLELQVTTRVIERVAPLDPASYRYLLETIFQNTWGERLRPYLSPHDFSALNDCCDPAHERFALRREDFHFIQTFTLVCCTSKG